MPYVLSSKRLVYGAIYKAIMGDDFCHCELRTSGIYFRTKRGELLAPLSEISAVWLVHGSRWSLGDPAIYEVQTTNKKVPEWRFVFALSGEHCFGSKTIPNLNQAVLKANPEASIIPTPDEFPFLARLHSCFSR